MKPRTATRRAAAATLVCGLTGAMLLNAPAGAAPTPTPSGSELMKRMVAGKPAHTTIRPGYSQTRIVVKFAEGSAVRSRGARFAAARTDLTAVNALLAARPGVQVAPLFSATPAQLERAAKDLAGKSHRQQANLSLYYRVTLPRGLAADSLIDALNALPVVELARPEAEAAALPTGPDLRSGQGYARRAPGGIDVGAWRSTLPGARGANVTIADIEYAWNTQHEDLSKARASGAVIANATPSIPGSTAAEQKKSIDHGTAVIGELVADENSFGVTGLVPDAGLILVNSSTTSGQAIANAVDLARQNLKEGDVILIEQQLAGANGGCNWVKNNAGTLVFNQVGCVAVEYDQAIYDAIVAATSAGIIVVEAAGNGSQDLDGAAYGSRFPSGRPDSGAIIVGAADSCSSNPQARAGFSTYGSRVNVHGWGGCVTTTGYGDVPAPGGGTSPVNEQYTSSFGGTSSAAPIVAAAAAAVSGTWRYARDAHRPTSTEVRTILQGTGTPQDTSVSSGNIGPMPDLRAALGVVGDKLHARQGTLDFDADGRADAFRLTAEGGGYRWQYSSGGRGNWADLGFDYTPLASLRFADFDLDGRTDVFRVVSSGSGTQWQTSAGGRGNWRNLAFDASATPLTDLRFGDFDGDGRADAFRAAPEDGVYQWYYSPGALGVPLVGVTWFPLAYSNESIDSLRFGDFDGDGESDVFRARPAIGTYQWQVSSAGTQSWANLAYDATPRASLRFGDFDGDGMTDAFTARKLNYGSSPNTPAYQWLYSSGGRESWSKLLVSYETLATLRVGDQ